MLDASVEVVHAVILAEGYGGSSQEVEAVANSGCKEIVRVFQHPHLPLFFGLSNERLCAADVVETVGCIGILTRES